MPEPIQAHERFRSDVVVFCDYCCRARHSGLSAEEESEAHGIAFVRAGAFARHLRGQEVLADANQVLFFRRNETYRVSHPVEGGDDCTVFRFAPALLQEAFGRLQPELRDSPEAPFPSTHSLCDRGSFLLQHRLRQLASSDAADALELEELSLELLDRVATTASRCSDATAHAHRVSTRRAHRDLVHAARITLLRTFREPLTVGDIARRVHGSPFHLARLFSKQTGDSLHQYRNRLRLRASLERLSEGEKDLTALALDLGFSSHSHFSDAFRRETGLTPTQFRLGANTARTREMSKILEA